MHAAHLYVAQDGAEPGPPVVRPTAVREGSMPRRNRNGA